MNADWLPVLASPKDPNKNLGKSGVLTFSSIAFDKLISSASTSVQYWPKSIPKSAEFYADATTKFKSFATACEALGTEFCTRVLLAAGKARATNAAVRVPAANIFIYAATQHGFELESGVSTAKNGDRAKQYLIRRKISGSASVLLRQALHTLGIDNLAYVATFAYSGGTQIILVPTKTQERHLECLYEYSLNYDRQHTADDIEEKQKNHVASYMRTVPRQIFFSTTSREKLFAIIDANCTSASYRYALKEAVADGLSNGFASNYCDASATGSRIFARGHSLQFMPGWLRKALFPDWFELDFSNMHLSILNAKANLGLDLSSSIWDQIIGSWTKEIKKIKDLLASEDFCEDLDIPILVKLFSGSSNKGNGCSFRLTSNIDNAGEIKKALKKSLYSLQFGMDKPSAKRQFTIDLTNAGFLNSEVALLGNLWAATPELDTIQKGVHNYCIANGINASKLALECQRKETEIVQQLYQIATRYKRSDLCITVHSHDGVSVWARNSRIASKFYKKCRNRTSASLHKSGINSRLEAKSLNAEHTKTSKPEKRAWIVVNTVINPIFDLNINLPPATGPP